MQKVLMKLSLPFLSKENELLIRYNKIWDKVSNSIKKGLNSKPVHKEKY